LSDIDPVEGVGAEDQGPELGETTSEAEQQPQGGEPERRYVEVDDPDDRYVRVRVDGEDVEVPYAEALKGYSREADYTRKAQALSQQRQELQYAMNLQQALEANPEMTLRILAEQYGQSLGQQQPQAPAEEDEFVDPLERAIAVERKARLDLEQRLAAQEADQQLGRAIDGLRSQYQLNEDDVREVVGVAFKMGLGVEALEDDGIRSTVRQGASPADAAAAAGGRAGQAHRCQAAGDGDHQHPDQRGERTDSAG
jgi:ribosomal protein L12E/L44/L45/RPP1/RPP2